MKEVFYIKSDAPIVAENSILFLIAGKFHISFVSCNTKDSNFVSIAYFEIAEGEDWRIKLEELYPELFSRFSKVHVVFDVPELVLIPTSLFKENDFKMHLQTLFSINQNSVLLSESVSSENLNIGYSVSKELYHWVNEKYPIANHSHLVSALLKSAIKNEEDLFFIDFRSGEFLVIVFKKGNLQLAQYCPFSATADILYYLLRICEQFSISQEEVKIYLSGLIEKDSTIYKELYKYFLELEFDEKSSAVNLSDTFDAFPKHYFSTICKVATCES